MNEAPVLLQREGTIGIVTLNRPENRNSMTPDLLDGFSAVIAEVRQDPDLRCVLITGRGPSFCAGADFRSIIQRQAGERPRQAHERSYAMYEPFLSVLDIEIPVIGALSGHAVGGGFGLALACDLRVASRDARYGANFARLGLHPGLAVSYLLPRLVGVSRAAEMLFTGQLISGSEAERIGLVNAAVAAEDVLARAMDIAAQIAGNAPIAVRMTKQSLYDGLDWQPRRAAFREAFAQAITVDTDDAREGIDALLAKRDPSFRGQ